MTRLIKAVKISVVAAVAAGGLAAMSASPASAYIACNRAGECWRVNDRFDYPAQLGIVIHPDDWRDHHRHDHYRFREDRDDRGYYDRGHWRTF
jgi:hypothetical protein